MKPIIQNIYTQKNPSLSQKKKKTKNTTLCFNAMLDGTLYKAQMCALTPAAIRYFCTHLKLNTMVKSVMISVVRLAGCTSLSTPTHFLSFELNRQLMPAHRGFLFRLIFRSCVSWVFARHVNVPG